MTVKTSPPSHNSDNSNNSDKKISDISDIFGNVVKNVPTSSECRKIIKKTLEELESNDFKIGFEDTVLHRVCSAINNYFPNMFWIVWNDCCMIDYEYTEYGKKSAKINRLINQYLNGDWELMDYWLKVVNLSKTSPEAFIMPSWGTSGT